MIKYIPAFILTSVLFTQSVNAQYCSGTVVKTTASGTFSDGSGSNNYNDNTDCMWLIAPPGAGTITLSFTGVFDLEVYNCSDKITVYDGGDTTASILAVLCGNSNMTPPAPVTSTGGNMFVRFTSDYSYNNGGWDASYTSTAAPPVYCSGQTNLMTASGAFSDGSGSSNDYSNNANCSWLIQPTGATSITVTFNSFDIETGLDFVKVYDNSTSPATQVGSYSGNSIPSPVTINSGSVLVEFTSNNTVTAPGWDASYTSTQPPPPVYCTGSTTLTAPAGTFDDGSGSSSNYANNSDCSWIINPSNANSITLSFGSFDTQSGVDLVQVYDNSANPPSLLGSFSGNTVPMPVTLTGNNMLVTFTSDASVNAAGWGASYSSTVSGVGIADIASNNNISIYPNPFHHTATLKFATEQNEVCELIVYDIYGKAIKKIQIPANTPSVTIDGSSLANGMYFYSINKKNATVHTGKLILE